MHCTNLFQVHFVQSPNLMEFLTAQGKNKLKFWLNYFGRFYFVVFKKKIQNINQTSDECTKSAWKRMWLRTIWLNFVCSFSIRNFKRCHYIFYLSLSLLSSNVFDFLNCNRFFKISHLYFVLYWLIAYWNWFYVAVYSFFLYFWCFGILKRVSSFGKGCS